jgi:large repetitive protein
MLRRWVVQTLETSWLGGCARGDRWGRLIPLAGVLLLAGVAGAQSTSTVSFTVVNGYPVANTSTAQPLTITPQSTPEGQPYTVTITQQQGPGGTWLTANPTSGTTGATSFNLGVIAGASNLAPGQYTNTATVAVGPPTAEQTFNTIVATLIVDTEANFTVTGSPALVAGGFSFGTYYQQFTTPGNQVLNPLAASPSAGAPATPTPFTVTQTLNANTPANLLVVQGAVVGAPTVGTTGTPLGLSYSAAVANGLTPGTYGGTVILTVNQGYTTLPPSISIPWTLTVAPEPVIQTTPTAAQGITLTVPAGGSTSSTIAVSASQNIPITVSVNSTPAGWLTVASAPATANAGSITISVNTTGLQGASYSGSLTITSASASNSPYTIPVTLDVAPVISSLSPSSVSAGSAGFTLTVNGAGFVNGSQIVFGGTTLLTTFVNAGSLTAPVSAAQVSSAGPVTVTVNNPDATTSAPATFTVTAAQTATPVITPPLQSSPAAAASPTLGNAITSGTNITGFKLYINGNFNAGDTHTVVWLNTSTGVSTTFIANSDAPNTGILSVSPTQIVVLIPAALFSTLVTSQVTANVTVTEQGLIFANLPPPPAVSNAAPFLINPPLASVGPILPSGAVGVAYSLPSLVSGGTAPFTTTLSSGTLPPGLSLAANTAGLSGTPSAGGDFTFSPQIVDAWGNTLTATDTVQIVATPVITPPLVPSSAAAGTPGLQLTVNGANFLVPANVGNAVLAGSVAEWIAPNAQPVVLATVVASATQLTATIPAALLTSAGTAQIAVVQPNGASSNTVAFPVVAPAITSLSPSFVTAGAAAFTLTVTGSNFVNGSQIVFGGTALATTFVNSGTLTAPVSAAQAGRAGTISVTVVNPGGATSAAATFTAYTKLTILTTTLFPGQVGSPYSFTLSATGGLPPYTWTVIGSLPLGLSLNPSTGVISGTWQTNGTFNLNVMVSDNTGQTATSQFSVVVNSPAVPLQILTASLPTATVGVVYAATFSANGGTSPYTFTLSGTAPPGLTFLSPSLIGTPTTAGQFPVGISVTDSGGGAATKTFVLTVLPAALSITTASLPNGQVGVAYSAQVSATGGVPPYNFTVGGFPGVTASAAGALAGTPTTAGTFSISATVTDTAGSKATQTYSVTIAASSLTLTTKSLPAGTVGVAYSAGLAASGGVPPYTFAASGLPGGLGVSGPSITGTPTATGSFNVTVTVTDSAKTTATATLGLTIAAPALTVTTTALANGTVGTAYSAGLAASGGVPPYTFAATGLPGGLSVSGTSITGTPTAAGTSNVTVIVTDSAKTTATASLTLTIKAPPLLITTSSLSGVVGTPVSGSLAASGGVPPYTFVATGLPSGVSASASGALSGTPSAPGSSTVAVTVTDSAGTTANGSVSFTVVLPPAPPLTFTGLSGSGKSASQSTLQVGLGSAYPVAVTVTLTLTFVPTSGPVDPAVQFSTGGTTATIVVPAGQTAGATSVGVQTGTVAGTITITAQLTAAGQNVTPSPAPSQTIQISAAAPVITSVTAASTSTGFTVTVMGFSNTRDLSQALFVFTAASGANLQTGQLTVSLSSMFSAYFGSSVSTPFGSQFVYTQPFTITGNQQAVTGVTVTLTNSVGTSAGVTASVP